MQNENVKLKVLKNQKIAILGLGEENLALAKYLTKHDINYTICDKGSREELAEKDIENLSQDLRLGPNYLDNLKDFDLIFRTPGLPYLNPKIQEAKRDGVEVSSEIKYFFANCPCSIIGVTGTKGKGTTATLIDKILRWKSQIPNLKSETNSKFQIQNEYLETRNAVDGRLSAVSDRQVYLAGNIGNAPIEFLDDLKPEDLVVLELSSFQLQDLEQSPHIAVVLDIKVDHLDYHKDEKEYFEAKTNLIKYQTKEDLAVINADYLTSVELASLTPAEVFWFSRRKSVDQGAWVKNNQEIILRTAEGDLQVCETAEIQLRGEHNLENICAAVTAAYLAGADIEAIKSAVLAYKGLEHRLELVGQIRGVKYYNDSFSTTPDTTIAAVKSFSEPIILLIGGSEKGADYQELARAISNSTVKQIINIGSTGQKIINLVTNSSIKIEPEITNIDEAVKLAAASAKTGEVVLLSPASASFDKFKNYKERGKTFKSIVLSLEEQT